MHPYPDVLQRHEALEALRAREKVVRQIERVHVAELIDIVHLCDAVVPEIQNAEIGSCRHVGHVLDVVARQIAR